MNFGETLAYWYLRLNGFFPITNFVLHRHRLTIEHSADCDVLAVRHPFVYEEIGGHDEDWDHEQFGKWKLDLRTQTIALIVEVKTGKNEADYRERIENAFNEARILYGVQRLGLLARDEAIKVTGELLSKDVYCDPARRFVIGKLLIAAEVPADLKVKVLKMSLKHADDFICARMHKYIDHKQPDRIRFPSDLLQYVIWRQQAG